MEVVLQRWATFIAKYPHAHVLLGRTRDITQWRNAEVLRLVQAQDPSGKFSVRRDLDDEQGYYLIHVGFELEADAVKLANVLRAVRVEPYAGYGSAFEFDPALLSPGPRRKSRAAAAKALMPVRRRAMDLRGRRHDLGVTVKEMSVGLGMSTAEISSIERGAAGNDRTGHYAAWLTRMYSWSAGKNARELRMVQQGQRYRPQSVWPLAGAVRISPYRPTHP
jgi:hypothetical protein